MLRPSSVENVIPKLRIILNSQQKDKFSVDTLLIFPFAGGMSSYFNGWKSSFGENVEVKPIELPVRGRKISEEMPSCIEDLISKLFEEEMKNLKGKISLFGHSMGAILAYEFAKFFHKYQPKKAGCTLHSLLVSGCGSPRTNNKIHHLEYMSDQEILDLVLSLNGTPRELCSNQEFRDFFLPILHKDLSLFNRYPTSDHPKFDLPLLVLRGRNDIFQSVKDARDWSTFTFDCFEFCEFDGDHFFINHTKPVIEKIIAFWKRIDNG